MAFQYGTYTFPSGVEVTQSRESSFQVKSRLQGRSFSDGGIDIGDGKVSPKTINLTVVIYGDSESDFLTKIDNFKTAICQKNKRLTPDGFSRYINIKTVKSAVADWINPQQYKKGQKFNVSFVCEDPFWYDTQEQSHTETITSSPTTFSITNDGTAETFATIEITAASDISTLLFENTTNDTQFDYTETSFLDTNVLTVNSVDGTVEREDADTIKFFSGSFIKLNPGSNSLKYTGGNCSIIVKHFKRYI